MWILSDATNKQLFAALIALGNRGYGQQKQAEFMSPEHRGRDNPAELMKVPRPRLPGMSEDRFSYHDRLSISPPKRLRPEAIRGFPDCGVFTWTPTMRSIEVKAQF